MQDQRVRESDPARLRQRGAQLPLDDDRVIGSCDSQAIRHAEHMSVDWEPRHAERVPEHDVGRFASDAR